MKALAVLQTWLDEMNAAMMVGDWESYRRHTELPFYMITDATTLVITTEAGVREGFDSFLKMLNANQVSDYLRLANSAEFLGDTLLSGGYVSHFLSAGKRVVPPFSSRIVLRRTGGIWRAVSIVSAVKNDRWPILTPMVDPKDERTS